MRRYKFALFLLILLIPSTGGTLQSITVNPANQRLVDELGRERFFHGTNIVIKQFPWHPKEEGFGDDSFSEKDMQLMQSLGLNVVRLGHMLAGLVPTRGNYNETYMQIMQNLVTTAEKYGIYVLLDMHQDVMSRKFCVEGFPDWAANPGGAQNFPEPLHQPFVPDPKTGYPTSEDCAKFPWASYYFSEAASVAFQNLYNNTAGLRDAWAGFWAKTAAVFRGYPSVIGYELINEPWAGDIYADPLLMVPGIADRYNLGPAYEVLARAIRQHDQTHCIFFEGVTWDDFGVGFQGVPGGEEYQNRSVLSYHFYTPPGGPDLSLDQSFGARRKDMERLRCGGMMTEFATDTGKIEDLVRAMDAADSYLQSWVGWYYRPFMTSRAKGRRCCALWDEEGNLDKILIGNTSRSYPQAVAGKTMKFAFSSSTKEFSLSYEVSADCKSTQTMVYLNEKMHYPTGYNVTILPEGAAKWSKPSENYVVVEHNKQTAPGTSISVVITKT